ncbi:MAG TPA: DUF6298 domain-containing protein, partial [Verrucomicrobiae bacterium]|nr:DUF6298 domain-containing protein [Verrucomicrobiae bacterium]
MTNLRFTIYHVRTALVVLCLAWFPFAAQAARVKLSPVISTGADGRLVYDIDARGNRVPDFSSVGYAGGDRAIPDAPVRVTVAPAGGDETARIQQAIDYVAGLPADADGIRGAVLLLKGRHEVFGQLLLTNSGVVLRGEGTNETTLVAAGIDRRTLIRIIGKDDVAAKSNPGWRIADEYVPVAADSFHVKDAAGLSVGERIFITRPSTKEWIEAIGTTNFGGGINDWRLVWKPGSRDLAWDRVIRKIDGNLLTLDAPITTAIETKFGGGAVSAYSWPGRINNVGIENLRLESTFDPSNPKDENHSWFAITMENAEDAWVRQVIFEHFAGSAVAIYETCKQVTVADCLSLAPVSEDGGWRRNTFFTMGQQTLFLRCRAEHGRHDFAVGHCAAGPNAFVDCQADLPTADSGAIQSWSSGTLFDNVRIDGNRLDLMNRGGDDEGAGWSAANSVLWNCIAAKIACENPPDAQNWAFGSWGEFEGQAIWRSSNETADPASLFVAQLTDRLGADKATRILAIAKIPTTAADAKSLDALPAPQPAAAVPRRTVSIANGWLVCDGKLLVGATQPVNWWKGNLLPSDAGNYGMNLSRYTPGRVGAGFTDDLGEIAGEMIADNRVAFDHHYGLWYDRRREDHERVRRMSGDVWPPFYEQPFARSGIGTAWDGLSKYDLTKFNPWYWSRLRQFAGLCDRRGLVLFNENYFQHNILEDGAHWVDCPWRSQNNINDTGFAEPPFEVPKRIVMAPQFYDVTNPVRRKLHENYIRQNLDNFTNEANVIQFTSGEFTGPLAFEQFWLDTIGAWEKETGRHPLIALCTPKDVQDAILADPQRAGIVDVICFRYWWQTDRGLFAPKGGQNLSPRQFERQWKGGAPNDEDLAAMAAEYRKKFPAKAIIAAGEDISFHGGWAYCCAGGSMPDLPRNTDPALLAAIPHMQPWLADDQQQLWALREPGKQLLVYASKGGKIDLSGDPGSFQLSLIDPGTGRVTPSRPVQGGGKVTV